MPSLVRLEELLPVLETVLQEGGEITFTPRGNSMRPMLKGGVDVITLKRFNRPLKKYALPLYRRENGQFVLHRVVGKNKDGYVMRGDNQLDK
ncbi:MAG: S24/S26 family peptidase, partial [Clostridia bacterium]|nr:S24/S26 family peptidase [Clostridia bacterium]